MPVLKTLLVSALATTVISTGHVDIGPRFVDDRWTLQVYDDPTWRDADSTVLQVTDDALLTVPDDPAYAFLPAKPGSDVYVIPQTQNPDVVWLGWNTQDPEVMETIDRGVTMTLTGVQGPGELTVYLQSGDFEQPQVLWPKPIWVDVNTHTHANWVFTEPGVYLVQLKLEADLIDGRTVSDTRELRFAVGSGTSPEDARAATWRPVKAAATPARAGTAEESGGVSTGVLIAAGALLLAAASGLVVARGRGAKRRARA
ncbi:choice-of-anchor M domain-containing protein [Solirubrobacter deserti]|uniref:Choice-of-anchor M domain-containing protein n=1 Tax=Solirubrobacter deserti TaxID=2282478 RepID=A0ABT4RCM6_9ACTN|nr:choice-of-anchor M domain-containing protein [Solirubrobacter deserti]MDA0136278.1 choice-of-anchor M domain-containing protein [Solirubrobacter deserti]